MLCERMLYCAVGPNAVIVGPYRREGTEPDDPNSTSLLSKGQRTSVSTQKCSDVCLENVGRRMSGGTAYSTLTSANSAEAARASLEMHRRNGDQLFSRIVTGDESWVHHSTPETKRQSMVWKKPEESTPKKGKVSISAGKVMAIVFWDCKGVLLVDYLPPNTTVNAARYCEVLTKLRAAIKRKRPGILSRKVLLVLDNARPHAARTNQTLVENFKWEIFTHPPYSPDLSPSNFHLFPALKFHLGGKQFAKCMMKCRRRRTTGYEDRTRLDAFRGVFGLQKDSARLVEEVLKSRAQKAEESSESYIQEILSLFHQVNPRMEEGEIVAHIIKGISEDTYQVLVAKDIQRLDEILKFCRHLTTVKHRRIGRTKFARLSNVMPISCVVDSDDLAALIRRIVREEIQKDFSAPEVINPLREVNALEQTVREEVSRALQPTRPQVNVEDGSMENLRRQTNLLPLRTTRTISFVIVENDGRSSLKPGQGMAKKEEIVDFRVDPRDMMPTTTILIDSSDKLQETQLKSREWSQKINLTLDTGLSEIQRLQLFSCFDEFIDIFDLGGPPIKPTSTVKHKINTGDHSLIKQRPYRVAPSERRLIQDEVNKICQSSLDSGVISWQALKKLEYGIDSNVGILTIEEARNMIFRVMYDRKITIVTVVDSLVCEQALRSLIVWMLGTWYSIALWAADEANQRMLGTWYSMVLWAADGRIKGCWEHGIQYIVSNCWGESKDAENMMEVPRMLCERMLYCAVGPNAVIVGPYRREGTEPDDPNSTSLLSKGQRTSVSTQKCSDVCLENVGRRMSGGTAYSTLTSANSAEAARASLEMHRRNGDQLFSRIVTGDESWVHHSTPETKRQSMVWKKPEESTPKKGKVSISAGKVMAIVFWDCKGVLLVDYLPPNTTVNAARYCEVLTKLRAAIKRKRPGILSRKVLLVLDNARPHAARTNQTLVENFEWEIFTHPPYSPDLSPSNLHLFSSTQDSPWREAICEVHDEVQAEANHWLRRQDTAWYNSGIKKLLQRYQKCLDRNGDYAEK
ncbi:hypothetical protein LAZ67_1005219 [Cordylochernes scorpioides]|uniref:Transposase n=1 Tax=Cordylochernes scorpioides TaxID=51811 RepID=A0ABY6JY25_9ARAC|nr:hypothetical protein LAZ67_1005219 [Cordylochernes scorpioides]